MAMDLSTNITSGALRRYVDGVATPQFKKTTVFYEKFGEKRILPKGTRYYAWTIMNRNTFTAQQAVLVEGVTPTSDTSSFNMVDFFVNEYGRYEIVSNLAVQDSPVDIYTYFAEELMRQLAQVVDTVVQTTLLTGLNVVYPSGRTSRGAITSTDIAKSTYFAQAYAQMRALAVPSFEGKYVAVIHPFVHLDLLTDSTTGQFLDVSKYSVPENLFNGEVGEMFGVRFVVSENVTELTAQGASGANVYPSYVMGKYAYGIVESEPLETIIYPVGSSGPTDPLRQRGSIGVRIRFGQNLLKQESLWRVETSSSLQTNPEY
jgi:N4-gp56 family major capsid protein